ncbi:hypothetical protein L249_8032 [Ophiocordyceps polyrhachis-furcata BCC 54312]|uniref:Uncharacterized protein n=1 Tax=Ophiocordyceps polyrhachis-furcata BCC 54312 TaxID=1330021 RepID=A0A367LIG2_9HYPO|nr:hypothetical protein L249_8032 [Ophiocordyceps polyrhachis-furcata BCC 54312]
MLGSLMVLLPTAVACGLSGCYGPVNRVEHVRHVKRMQPGASDAVYGPKRPLEWGQVNFLHTTDTHGWLQGHLKERNYGADWGDFVSFARRMKEKAGQLGVDLLLVDTGDLHDGTGLSDATPVDGTESMAIFDQIDYDLLAVGNHELYLSEVTYQMLNDYARKWGDRYVTSNVQVLNRTSGEYQYLGATHRYFTTAHGLRIMAFGVLFDFSGMSEQKQSRREADGMLGNSNASRVIKAADMVEQDWFKDALSQTEAVDLFVLLGHNPVRPTERLNTLKMVFDAIRAAHPATPIQLFGGHTHIRDFAVYDDSAVALESGRYCETLGWASVAGFNSCEADLVGVDKASRPARPGSKSRFVYSRRYLDWNRKTFVYHSQNKTLDVDAGRRLTSDMGEVREKLRLGQVYGCVPQDWCAYCAPFDDGSRNIFPGVIYPAARYAVVNKSRADRPRTILGNTGGIRFDLHKGPFTRDDSMIVSPFRNTFLFIADVPFAKASRLLDQLNRGIADKRHVVSTVAGRFGDDCKDPTLGQVGEMGGIIFRRQESVTPGYVTTDDWGDDGTAGQSVVCSTREKKQGLTGRGGAGDDTEHSKIPSFTIPKYWEARASFPANGSEPERVDVVFVDFIKKRVLEHLGEGFNGDMVHCYVDCNFTSQDFLIPYAELAWQANRDDCAVVV